MADMRFYVYARDPSTRQMTKVAETYYAEDAAAVVACHGAGTEIRWGKHIVYIEPGGVAANSYDECAFRAVSNAERAQYIQPKVWNQRIRRKAEEAQDV